MEVGFDVQSVTRDGAAGKFRDREAEQRRARAHRQRRPAAQHRAARICHPLSHHAADRLLRRLRRALLERHRHRLDLRRSIRPRRASRCPKRVPFTQTAFYTGPQGARGKDAAIVEQRPGRIVFRTTRPLPARNGLTVAAAWQKGIVTPPTRRNRRSWLLQDNMALLRRASSGLRWSRLSTSLHGCGSAAIRRRGTIIPLFGPPDGMSAAAVRYVDQMGFDNSAFTAAHHRARRQRAHQADRRAASTRRSSAQRRQADRPRRAGDGDEAVLGRTHRSCSIRPITRRSARPRTRWRTALEAELQGKLFANNYGWSSARLAAGDRAGRRDRRRHRLHLRQRQRARRASVGMLIPIIPVMIGACADPERVAQASGGTRQLVSAA